MDVLFIHSIDTTVCKFKGNVFFLWCEKNDPREDYFSMQEEGKEEIGISTLIQKQENVECK